MKKSGTMRKIMALLLAVVTAVTLVPEIGNRSVVSAAEAKLSYMDATTLQDNLTIDEGETLTLGGKITISGNVTIKGEGTIKRGNDFTEAMFEIMDGSTLNLDGNVTIDGDGAKDDRNVEESAIDIKAGGIFNMNGGTITNNNGNYTENWTGYMKSGGAVHVEGNGTFNMNGGTITKNCVGKEATIPVEGEYGTYYTGGFNGFGAGVYVAEKGTFNMNGGIISDNKVFGGTNKLDSDGGAVYNAGKFVITGGTIKDNYATGSGGGIMNSAKGSIKMTGGVISGNSGHAGGGMANSGVITLDGNAVIKENIVRSFYGGGGIKNWNYNSYSKVLVKVNVSGNPYVSGNIRDYDGKITNDNVALFYSSYGEEDDPEKYSLIHVTGVLDENARIGINSTYLGKPALVNDGGKFTIQNFPFDNERYALDENGIICENTEMGDGTKENPYIVNTFDDLRTYLPQGYVKLGRDIEVDYSINAGLDSGIKETGLDLNGHVLDLTKCSSDEWGISVRGNVTFTLSDSNKESEHDEKYITSDGTKIRGGIITGFDHQTLGGGFTSCIYVMSGKLIATGGTFFKNTAHGGGNCIGISDDYSTSTISNVNFYDNSNQYWSSCIWTDGASLTISNCNFIGNYGKYTGVIKTEADNTIIQDCIIKNNKSDRYGMVCVEGNVKLIIKNTVITDNISIGESKDWDSWKPNAGVYIDTNYISSPTVVLDGKVTISNNTVNDEQRNVYCSTPVLLGENFDKASQVGVFYRNKFYEDDDYTVVKNIEDYEKCFTSDTSAGLLYVKDEDLHIKSSVHTHKRGNYHEKVEATCTSDGTKAYYDCANGCNAKLDAYASEISDITIPAKGHTEVTDPAVDATCTKSGKTEGSHCTVCGEVIKAQEEIAPIGHDFGDWQIDPSPTCTDEGSKKRVCTICGYTETQDIDSNGHDWENDYTVDKEATCTEDGSKSIHCKNCSEVKDSIVIKAIGHSEVEVPEVAATCTVAGKTSGSYCSTCGTVIVAQKEIPATGHKWNSGVQSKAPTYTEEGEMLYTCEVCGDTKTEVIEKLKLNEYDILEGADGTHVLKEDGAYTVRVNCALEYFVAVQIDGKVVDSEDYTVESGSTIVTFTKEFMDSLSVGEHEVKFIFTNGTAKAAIKVVEKTQDTKPADTKPDDTKQDTVDKPSSSTDTKTVTTTPKTPATKQKKAAKSGDENPAMWVLFLIMLGGAGAATYGMKRKKTRL
ncbi:hypothetical protein [Agathobacter sp.]